MSIEQAILDAIRDLPLAHALRLRDQATPKHPFQSVKGILAGRGISISADDIDEARREMWKSTP